MTITPYRGRMLMLMLIMLFSDNGICFDLFSRPLAALHCTKPKLCAE